MEEKQPKRRRHPRQKRTKAQQAADHVQVSREYQLGKGQAEIALMLNVSKATVSRHLTKLTKDWLEEAKANFDDAKARELAKINNLEREYWQAWERSLQPVKTAGIKQVDSDKPRKETSTKKEDRFGNPAFLDGIQWCIEQRCKLLGLNAPVKVAPTGPDGKTEYKPYSLEDFSGVIAKAREYEEALRCGSNGSH